MDKRIDEIVSFVAGSKIIIDIGTDHAYALIKAVKKFDLQKAYAVDIALGPLNNAIANIKINNLEEKIIPILSDGFTNINFSFDSVIISGMGGILIKNILDSGISKIKDNVKLVIEANKDTSVVRQFLFENNFRIIEEKCLIEKNHFYEIIVAKFSNEKIEYNQLDILYGPKLRLEKNLIFKKHYNAILTKRNEALTKTLNKTKIIEEIRILEEILGT